MLQLRGGGVRGLGDKEAATTATTTSPGKTGRNQPSSKHNIKVAETCLLGDERRLQRVFLSCVVYRGLNNFNKGLGPIIPESE